MSEMVEEMQDVHVPESHVAMLTTARERLRRRINPLVWSPLNAAFEIVDRGAGVVRYTPQRLRVAIVCGATTRFLAPVDDPTWDVWGLNLLGPRDREGRVRADRWFEIHPFRAQSESDLIFIAGIQRPNYTIDWELLPNPFAVAFPLRAILEAGFRDYFACSMAYQIAMALSEGYEEIGLYGLELLIGDGRERSFEAACVSWWIGFAEGRGVKVTVPTMLGALRQHPFRYGYDYEQEAVTVMSSVTTSSIIDQQYQRNRVKVG